MEVLNKNKATNLPYVYGKQPVRELLSSTRQIDKIFVNKMITRSSITDILEQSKKRKIAIKFVPVEKLNRLCRENHQGVVAVLQTYKYLTIKDLVEMNKQNAHHKMILALDGITDVRNFGAIVRSAYYFAVKEIIIPNTSSVSVSQDAIKTSSGALNKVNICKVNSLIKSLDEFRMLDYKVVALQKVHQSKNIFSFSFPQKTILIVGNENKGVHQSLLKYADDIISIPDSNTFDSLNVSVATGIAMYEFYKQNTQNNL